MKTFAGIPEENAQFESSEIVLIPVPYDGTSTWGKGADKGVAAMLEAAENLELYDIETDYEVYRKGVFLAPSVTESSSPESITDAVYQTVKQYLSAGKFVTMFGGEHSVSIGAIQAFKDSFGDITVLQLDAHADLRPSYQGSSCNHACAAYEASKTTDLVQVGIRSMDISEKEHLNINKTFFAHDIRKTGNWQESVIAKIDNDQVYITIDLDAFDPSIMPSTGTPEPGGLYWDETLQLLRKVFDDKNVIGFDIVELAPIKGLHGPNFLAAKLYYKLLCYKYYNS